jgi:hypothetical protein
MTRNTETLPQLAKKYRALEKKDIGSLIEKGRLLQVAFEREDHGDRAEYHAWVAEELDISTSQEARYRNVFAFSEISQSGKFGEAIKIADLNISRTALYELADEWDAYPPGIVAEVLRLASTAYVAKAQVNGVFDAYREACAATEAAADETVVDDEPEPELDVVEAEAGPGDEPEPELDVIDDEPDATPPEPNDLSRALETILDLTNHNGEHCHLWEATTKLISQPQFTSLIGMMKTVATKHYGSGSDAFRRAEARSEQAKYIAKEKARRAALNAPLLAPITPEKEQAYTRLIKTCTLYEGACDLSWSEYFAYRDAHPECEALTKANLAYAGQWTSCAVVREAA